MCTEFLRILLMDVNHKVLKTDTTSVKDLNGADSPTSVVSLNAESDGEDESHSLLQHHPRSGGLSKHSNKPKRKVQWLDRNGHGSQLAEVLEFQPSDVSDSDDDDSDSCICRIM